MFIAAFLMTSGGWLCFAFAEQYVSSALAGIMNGATPLLTLVAILIAFPEEKPTPQRIVGLVLGFGGVLIVIGVWNGLGGGTLLGIGACWLVRRDNVGRAATLAGVVVRNLRLRERLSAVARPRKSKTRADVLLPVLDAGTITLVEPCDEQRPVGIQRLRDEAHRFAITYHRTVRATAQTRSALDGIAGLGPVRRKALVRALGSVRAVREATLEELIAVPGIDRRLAERIRSHLDA